VPNYKPRNSATHYRSLSTFSGGGERRWKPVVVLTASTPRHTTVPTDEANSRSDSTALGSGIRDESLDKPGSTSSSGGDGCNESDDADLNTGTGREADGDSLRA
jgi:hypothetical protein